MLTPRSGPGFGQALAKGDKSMSLGLILVIILVIFVVIFLVISGICCPEVDPSSSVDVGRKLLEMAQRLVTQLA